MSFLRVFAAGVICCAEFAAAKMVIADNKAIKNVAAINVRSFTFFLTSDVPLSYSAAF